MSGWQHIRDLTRAEHDRFMAATRRPMDAQTAQLTDILRVNGNSEFGRHHGFSAIEDPDAFRARVPVSGYDAFDTEIRRMAAGEPDRLCATPVVTFEQTSGSHSGGRLIPYTAGGLAAFRRAVLPWLHDLLRARPGISRGRAYWTISPAARPGDAGAPTLGVATDAQYFGEQVAGSIARLSAAPMSLARVGDIDAWRYLLLRHLLAARDLTLVSVWSPTFLTTLLDSLLIHADSLIADIAEGSISWALDGAPANGSGFRPDPARAEEIAVVLSDGGRDIGRIWPVLDTVSCWTHGSAASFVDDVALRLPGAWIQPKGLLATEAAVSIPLVGSTWPVLAINSGFFEFLDDDDNSFLCDEVETGETYRVVVTTHSGLYRYDLGDRITVRGRSAKTPMFEFVGRGRLVSDLCGEKLADAFVSTALGDEPGFAMLAPASCGRGYVVFLDASRFDAGSATSRAQTIEKRLADNPHYAHARRLGQLSELKAVRVVDPLGRYYDACMARGQRIGEIKPAALRTEPDWEAIMDGVYAENTIGSAAVDAQQMRALEGCP